jgi:hypothetical protein
MANKSEQLKKAAAALLASIAEEGELHQRKALALLKALSAETQSTPSPPLPPQEQS